MLIILFYTVLENEHLNFYIIVNGAE